MSKHNFRKGVANFQAILYQSMEGMGKVEKPLRSLSLQGVLLFVSIYKEIPIFNYHVAVRGKTT
jgi:hypothetical protein